MLQPRNEILKSGQVIYIGLDDNPYYIKYPTVRLAEVHHLDGWKDAWDVQDVDTGHWVKWYPDKIKEIKPIID